MYDSWNQINKDKANDSSKENNHCLKTDACKVKSKVYRDEASVKNCLSKGNLVVLADKVAEDSEKSLTKNKGVPYLATKTNSGNTVYMCTR